jgi:GNAT superfamily N-acetyltransferase
MNTQALDDIVTRPATNRDRERVVALIFGVLAEYGLPSDLNSKDSDLNDIEGSYMRSGGVFEVLEDSEGNLLGTYGLYPLDEETCELRKMYFVPEIRGRGLGRRVLERAVGHARRLGFKAVELETISVLKEAIRLYTRFGFVPTEAREVSARVDQAYILKLSE